MAQSTSDLWKVLQRDRNTVKEYGFDIDGVWYGSESEVSHKVNGKLYEDFGIGNAAGASLTLRVVADSISKTATIKRFVRLRNGGQTSEWLPKGVFFTNRLSVNDGEWDIQGYDAMCKSDATYLPDVVESNWPIPMAQAVDEIAERMEVSVDPRTNINPSYMLQYPAGYTMRDVLCEIAAAHCGNWVITDTGALLLVPLLSMPAETTVLIDQYGDAISLGGVRILV